MTDFYTRPDALDQINAETDAAIAKQNAERRVEAQKERAKVKTASEKVIAEVIDTFLPPPERPAAPPRSFLNELRDKLPVTPQQRERWRIEDYHARRQALVDAEMKQHKRGQEKDELGVNGLVNPPEIDWDEVDNDDSDYYDED